MSERACLHMSMLLYKRLLIANVANDIILVGSDSVTLIAEAINTRRRQECGGRLC